MQHLIVSDIDHTLLSNTGELLADNVTALGKARRAGATVVLATARSFIGALPVHRALGLETPLIVSNGTIVCDPDGTILMTQAVEAATARAVFDLFETTPHHWSLRRGDVAHLHPKFDCSRAPFDDARYYKPLLGVPQDFFGAFDDVVTLSLFGRDLRAFYDMHPWIDMALAPSYYAPSYYDPREAMTLMSASASKGEAVRWVQKYLGLGGAPVLTIGDSPADATMFACGVGVAPAYASAEALSQAHWVGPCCDEGVVAAAVRRFVFGELEEVGLEEAVGTSQTLDFWAAAGPSPKT